MLIRKYLFFFTLLVAFFFFNADAIKACTCVYEGTVAGDFAGSKSVILAEITGIEKANADEPYYLYGVRRAKMSVKKVFKGKVKIGDEMSFRQGGGGDCIMTYREKDIGEKVLIYSDSESSNGDGIFTCGRSGKLKWAQEDLLYLEKVNKVRGKTRLSGTISYSDSGLVPDGYKLGGIKVKITGGNRTQTIKTDANGIYEIYGLPAGKYLIEPQIPAGARLERTGEETSDISDIIAHSLYVDSEDDNSEDDNRKRFPVKLLPGGHVSLDFYYYVKTGLRGKLLDPTGQPLTGIEICAENIASSKKVSFDYTNEKGIFTLGDLNGKYVITANCDEKARPEAPLTRLFYPGVAQRSQATVFSIREGQKLNIPAFRVQNLLDTINLTGKLFYSDGTPATSSESVVFIADKQEPGKTGNTYTITNKSGDFSIDIFKDQNGKIRARKYFTAAELEKCPDIKKAPLEPTTWGSISAFTPWLEIKGDRNLKDIKLTFPFVKCE